MFNMAVILTLPPRRAQKHAFSSKAAGSPAAEVSLLGTSQDDGQARTKLEAIFNICSFHRHALGKIPRLIHVRPPQHRNMIGEELQGNREQDRRHQGMRVRNGKYRISRPA